MIDSITIGTEHFIIEEAMKDWSKVAESCGADFISEGYAAFDEVKEFIASSIKSAITAQKKEIVEELNEIKQIKKPTHGTCCTCQTCGNDYDNCCCERNEIIDALIHKLEEKYDLQIM